MIYLSFSLIFINVIFIDIFINVIFKVCNAIKVYNDNILKVSKM